MKTISQFLYESKQSQIHDFIDFASQFLNLSELPRIIIISDKNFSIQNKTFGCYDMGSDVIRVQTAQRHPMDIFRTLAHELVHYSQKKSGQELNGEDGSDHENEANAKAAVMLRQYSKQISNHGY